jgi:hypothetical protein
MKKSSDTIGNRSRDLPVCYEVPQPLRHRVPQMYSSTLSLTSALDAVGGQRHTPPALPRERPGTHCIGGWVGPRAGLDGPAG